MNVPMIPNFDSSMLQSILNQTSQKSKEQDSPQLQDRMQIDENGVRTIDITAFNEWRFELKSKDKLKLKLVKGTAEIFGTELSTNIEYSFQGSLKSCVSTFRGCQIQIWNCQIESEYVSEESCMVQYLNLHLTLQNERVQAHKMNQLTGSDNKGPKALIVGAKDSGKTALSKTLAAYGEKMDMQPLLINLNPRQSQFATPGSLTATPISDMLNVENINLGETITTGPSFYHQKQPNVKTFGMEKYSDNLQLFKYLVQELGSTVLTRMSKDLKVAESGLIIDTPAFGIDDYQLIQHIIKSFDVNLLVVMGTEKLLFDLKKKVSCKGLRFIKMNKSSGCVDNDDKFERELQQRSIKEYFYGIESLPLSPYTITINLKDVVFLKPKELEDISPAFLSGDQDDEEDDDNYDPTREYVNYRNLLERMTDPNSDNLSNAILALVDDSNVEIGKILNNIESDDVLIESVLKNSTIGYSYVLNCDDTKKTLKLLIPSPVQQLPTKTLILTQSRYHE